MTGGLKKRQEQELIRGGKKLRMGAKKEWSESTEREEREREKGREGVRQRRRVMSPLSASQWESGKERGREGEHAAGGGCVFLSLQHQQREEGHNQFHRDEEEKT